MSVTPHTGASGPEALGPRMALDHHPSTTMGAFDVLYEPVEALLTITLRAHFQFLPEDAADAPDRKPAGWASAEETGGWTRDFIRLIESTWGGRFVLRCTSPAWSLPSVRVAVQVKEVSKPEAAHHQVRVRRQGVDLQRYRGENRPEPMWDPSAPRIVILDQYDIRAVPHQTGAVAVRDAITKDLAPGLSELPDGQPNDELHLRFDDGGRLVSTPALQGLAGLLRPWPADRVAIQLIGLHSPPAQQGTSPAPGRIEPDEARRRCGEVRQALQALHLAYPVTEAVMAPRMTKATPGMVRLSVGPVQGFAPTTPYSTAAHEMGHALGNVDFYRDDRRRARSLVERGVDGDPDNRVQMALGRAQDGFLRLVAAAGMTAQSPAIGVVSDSVMSMGMQVLPIHYLPFWEALTRLTAAHIHPEEWVIADH